MRWTIGRAIASAVIGVLGLSGPAAAQEMWLGPTGSAGSFSIELLRPSFRNGEYGQAPSQSLASGALFATLRIPVRSDLRVILEVPAARGAFDAQSQYDIPAQSGFSLGNPYLGVETGTLGSAFSVEGGVRIPIVGEPSTSEDEVPLEVGQLADLERMEAFAPKVAVVSLFTNYRVSGADGFRFRLRGGPLARVYTSSGDSDRTVDLWLGYGMQAGYEGRALSVFGGFAGRTLLSRDAGGVGQRTLDEFVASASVDLGGVRPGIMLRLPLDDAMNQVVGHVLGLTLSVPLGK